jgi:o-succinylbenzoate synthase
MLKARHYKKNLLFKKPARTSRNTLYEKECCYIEIWNDNNPQIKGVGECGYLYGLSADNFETYDMALNDCTENIHRYTDRYPQVFSKYPSLIFAVEQALLDLQNQGKRILFNSGFVNNKKPIEINGLIWMDNAANMIKQAVEKINNGFKCIKMKIGAIDFQEEINVIEYINNKYGKNIEIRVDANGAYNFEEAIEKLNVLKTYNIHSIEQPLKKGDCDNYKKLCEMKIIPVALDEELIGVNTYEEKKKLIEHIKPQYLVLKPSLLGGFSACEEWINIARENSCGWWITSALESNIGLNAIAQWTYTLNTNIPQGLGTGSLYINNIQSPLEVNNGKLYYNRHKSWQYNII